MKNQKFNQQESAQRINTVLNINAILTEVELLNWLKINFRALEYLRHENGLPCRQISKNIRIYVMKDILDWTMSGKT